MLRVLSPCNTCPPVSYQTLQDSSLTLQCPGVAQAARAGFMALGELMLTIAIGMLFLIECVTHMQGLLCTEWPKGWPQGGYTAAVPAQLAKVL